MKLENLGLNDKIRQNIKDENLNDLQLGRVLVEHRERYIVQTKEGVFNSEITGNLRYSAGNRSDLPAVGDWVKLTVFDQDMAIITDVMPRYSVLERQSVGKFGEKQIIAANVDVAFIMQSVGHDYNLNRFERYLTVCNSSSIKPVIVLSKIDLLSSEETERLIKQINERIKDVPVLAISNSSQEGYDDLRKIIEPGKTYCFLGSSGVGKSSLTNNLLEKQIMENNALSESTNKGRHVTSHRELFVLSTGGIIIDTPGMREIGITDASQSIEQTFDDISELASQCKYDDCTHINESGCAVLEAVNNGEIDQSALDNYHKLKREQMYFSESVKEKRDRDKKFGKHVKNVLNERKKYKF